jgi:NAD(P)-dependent dehydrogenase (short-subunit alcohol dehydrogenase family)
MATGTDNSTVLITGGSRGIGAAIVRSLEASAYSVIVLDITDPETGFKGEYVELDLGDAAKTTKLLQQLVKQQRILRLVNNVGIVRPASVDDTALDDFQTVIETNARSTLLCTQAVLPSMRAAQFGRIVSVTSRVILGKQLRTAYAASKGAITAMTRTWALELAAAGITVNAVAPGPIGTELFVANNPADAPATKKILESIPMQRVGTPDEVAHAVSFFLDNRSGFVTGQTLYVCGGMTVGLCNS